MRKANEKIHNIHTDHFRPGEQVEAYFRGEWHRGQIAEGELGEKWQATVDEDIFTVSLRGPQDGHYQVAWFFHYTECVLKENVRRIGP